ncbi:PODO protein, partial [Atractosteus spatula]|nr:PODO protein [Atractosteus spatula]
KPHSKMERRSRSVSRSGRRGKDSPSTSQSRESRQRASRKGPLESRTQKSSEPKVLRGAPEVENNKAVSTVVNVDSVAHIEQEEIPEDLVGLLESEVQEEALKSKTLGICEWILTGVALIVIILFFPFSVWFCVKIVQEHERAVVFRLGHLMPGKARGPGLFFYLPFLDVYQKVDIRINMLVIPSHKIVTKDMVTMELSAVCYYRVENVSLCFTVVTGISNMVQVLVQTTVKDILAHHSLTHILIHRRSIAQEIKVALDAVTCQWGIKVERIEIDDLSLPAEIQHTFSTEAEAKRQAQIKVIAAEGEKAVCEALKASAEILSGSPTAVHLRYLQILHNFASERSTIILPLPSDLLSLAGHSTLLGNSGKPSLTEDPSKKEPQKDSPML